MKNGSQKGMKKVCWKLEQVLSDRIFKLIINIIINWQDGSDKIVSSVLNSQIMTRKIESPPNLICIFHQFPPLVNDFITKFRKRAIEILTYLERLNLGEWTMKNKVKLHEQFIISVLKEIECEWNFTTMIYCLDISIW